MVRARGSLTYARSGVNVASRRVALAAMLSEVTYRPPPSSGRPLRVAGHFAGLTRIGRETIAATTDTVGTKVLIAEEIGDWEPVGQDMVAINVNDLCAVGARPFGLVDVISSARPDPTVLRAIGRGLNEGLRQSRCALLGGETAVVPDLVPRIDLGGTALGFFPKGRAPVTGRSIRPGDSVIGLAATGFHANGYTMLRRIVAERRLDLRRPRPGGRRPLGAELLTATRIYVRAVEAIADDPGVHGLCHISGGGVRNLSRLHEHVEFRLDRWPRATGLFRWVTDLGEVAPKELYQTFNMGIGFAVVVAPRAEERILRKLTRAGSKDAHVIGEVVPGDGVSLPALGLRYEGYE